MEISGLTSSGMDMSSMSEVFRKMREAQGAADGPPADFASKMAGDMITSKDGDGDGSLSVAETGLSEEAFGKVDANGDGLLDSDELEAGVAGRNDDLRSLLPPPPLAEGDRRGVDATNMLARSLQGYASYQGSMSQDLLSSLFSDQASLSANA